MENRPICIRCNRRKVRKNSKLNTGFRKTCDTCGRNPTTLKEKIRRSNLKKNPYRGVKKDFCEWPECTTTIWHSVQLQVDHIDGNHSNNNIENLQTLCAACHVYKTYINGENKPMAARAKRYPPSLSN